jgi:3-oxoacyl-[acyl-carrier protein] reductase
VDLGISGKSAFVSGGSSGMGRAIAETLAREGCNVTVAALARDQDQIDQTVKSILADGGQAVGIGVDLTVADEVERAVALATTTFGAPDIAVANVDGPGPGHLEDVSDADFEQSFKQMAMSMIYLSRAVLPHMKEQRWGRIVNMGSIAAKEPPPELAHILANTSRAAVVALNKSLSNEYAKFGITVNTIGTGYIGTQRMENYFATVAEKKNIDVEVVRRSITDLLPADRVGTPEEMAGTVAFLCSQQAGYVQGALIPVDGGLHRSAW